VPTSDLAQVHFSVPTEAAEAVASLLTEFAGGVEQRDSETLAPATAGVTEFLVWISASEVKRRVQQVEILLGSLKELGTKIESWSWKSVDADPALWQEAYKRFFQINRIGRHVVIKPSWEKYASIPGDLVAEIDPGMAFGTGLHASTRLVLRAMERIARTGPNPNKVLDLGTGSGILSIVAARIWPGCRVLAVDPDEIAVEICRDNVKRNGLEGRITVEKIGAAQVEGRFALVVANLTRELLLDLHPRMRGLADEPGRMVLSGFLAEDTSSICRLYGRNLAFEPEYSEEEDGWRSVLFRTKL
jgi:ribosomal protein L11 methyltransferase